MAHAPMSWLHAARARPRVVLCYDFRVRASVAQGIEHRSPKAGVDGSNPPGGTREYDGVAGAAPFLVCGGRRRMRAVDTRATNFPAGEFSNPPGGTREYDGVAGAAPFLVCGGRRAARPWGTGICFLECAAVNLSRVVQRELPEAAEELSAVDLEARNHLFDIVLGDSELR